ncbi:zf-TFIIB domain-containing protein [Bradyrhizobium sp. ARR65]|uniref:zf-TFIIB domain-containing protein n=1 Tax=Bradyrhizobium sp. ARR65 TaxID=1040989 RepID=UPI000A019B70|nr:zf-TFIIB domain-containing protein [Bradyrhizobium sp. ARR65]
MQRAETISPIPLSSPPVRSECPECRGELTILRVFSGRAGSEYWAQRCTSCGGIHLDIVRPGATGH